MNKIYVSADGKMWQEIKALCKNAEKAMESFSNVVQKSFENNNDITIIANSRRAGKSIAHLEYLEQLKLQKQIQPKCDCVNCRMGKFNQCTTYRSCKHR